MMKLISSQRSIQGQVVFGPTICWWCTPGEGTPYVYMPFSAVYDNTMSHQCHVILPCDLAMWCCHVISPCDLTMWSYHQDMPSPHVTMWQAQMNSSQMIQAECCLLCDTACHMSVNDWWILKVWDTPRCVQSCIHLNNTISVFETGDMSYPPTNVQTQ